MDRPPDPSPGAEDPKPAAPAPKPPPSPAAPAAPAPPGPRTLSFSLTYTRQAAGDELSVDGAEIRLSARVRTLAVAAAAFLIFVLEPLVLYYWLSHHGVPAPIAAVSPQTLDRSASAALPSAPSLAHEGSAPGHPADGSADIITPLNVRDPAALVMGPSASAYPASPPAAPPETDPNDDWKKALEKATRKAR